MGAWLHNVLTFSRTHISGWTAERLLSSHQLMTSLLSPQPTQFVRMRLDCGKFGNLFNVKVVMMLPHSSKHFLLFSVSLEALIYNIIMLHVISSCSWLHYHAHLQSHTSLGLSWTRFSQNEAHTTVAPC